MFDLCVCVMTFATDYLMLGYIDVSAFLLIERTCVKSVINNRYRTIQYSSTCCRVLAASVLQQYR